MLQFMGSQRVGHDLETEQQPNMDFPGGLVAKNLPASIGDRGSIPDIRRPHVPWGS